MNAKAKNYSNNNNNHNNYDDDGTQEQTFKKSKLGFNLDNLLRSESIYHASIMSQPCTNNAPTMH